MAPVWGRLRLLWHGLLTSLWFTPALVIFGGVVLAVGMIALDEHIGPSAVAHMPRLFGSGADGARSLLAAVATSMVAVASVAFSITIVALAQASSQYSSRVLGNFMGNRVNQTVLGVLMAIFVYCLIVLRTVRGGDEAFVPSISVVTAIVLAFVGIGFFVYYIHHTASSIQASQVLASLARDTIRSIDACFADEAPERALAPSQPPPAVCERVLKARETGYIQSVDVAALAGWAGDHGVVVRMEKGIGEFVVEGAPLVSCGPHDGGAAAEAGLHQAFVIGAQRTVVQDPAFGMRQMVDVALRALSPGIADTTTAQMCLDRLSAIVARLSMRRIECPAHFEAGELRLIAHGPTFESLVHLAFDQIRENGRGNAALLEHLLSAIEVLADLVPRARRHVLADQAAAVRRALDGPALSPYERERLLAKAARVIDRLRKL